MNRALRDRLDFGKWGKVFQVEETTCVKIKVLCAQARLGSQELKGKEEPDTAGLKSLGEETELFSGVSQKSLRKAFRKGRKQLACITYYIASKNFTCVKLNLYNCL